MFFLKSLGKWEDVAGMILELPAKIRYMEKIEKLKLMDKILRELEDTINSETALVKKIAQLEAENINLGDRTLEEKLPEIFEQIDNALATTTELQNDYVAARNKFSKDNKLEEVPEV
jgi:hypothetical protein